MRRRIACFVAVALALGIAPRVHAQEDQKDPLTPDEVQQIRENAIHPDERIKLYMKFIDQRLDALRQLIGDPGARDRNAQIHDKLDEFVHLCDEIQDNLDTYDSAHADIRKSLKQLVADSAKWSPLLQSLPQNRAYDFAQKMALEAAQSAEDEAKHLSAEQDVYFDVHKKQRHTNGSAPS
ncbi:MAG TPA: hypothetical protein VJS11_06735 [Acidobacteriaceae bacterium]|nr:hypothetical protein [Acidobacteriaceae bacterium]